MKKYLPVFILILSACSSSHNDQTDNGTNLPSVNLGPGEISYVRARTEFDISSVPSGSAKFELVKKSYAAGLCSHSQCTDFSDLTVTNNAQVQFSLIPSQQQASISDGSNNNQLADIIDLQVGILFDNELVSCGGQKCNLAALRIYTTDDGGIIANKGLYNSVSGQSIELDVSGGNLLAPTAVPYNPTDGTSLTIDSEVLDSNKNVINFSEGTDFSDAGSPGFKLSANFSQAGAGTYKSHVVVEYILEGKPVPPVVSGLLSWFNASTINTEDGATLLKWDSIDGSDADSFVPQLNNPGSSASFKLSNSSFNGQSTLSFIGNNVESSRNYFQMNPPVHEDFTIVVVEQQNNDPIYWGSFEAGQMGIYGDPGNMTLHMVSPTGDFNTGTSALNTPHYLIYSSSSITGLVDYYNNGSHFVTAQTIDVTIPQSPLNDPRLNGMINIGGMGDSDSSADIAEVLIYDHAFSQAEIDAMNSYMQNKYGL
jgi:hypothetical protein